VSLPQLEKLSQVGAFEPTPSREWLSVWHVPFDSLCNNQKSEQALDKASRAKKRVVIMGASGSGKSSMLAWAFRDEVAGLAPVRVRVAAEEHPVISKPGEFAAHLVETVARQARLLSNKEAKQLTAPPGQQTRTWAFKIGPPKWLLTGGVSREIVSVAERKPRSADQQIEIARAVMKTISSKGLVPVLVVDDADQWLSGGDDDKLVADFFSRVMRVMCENLPAAIVVAANYRYLSIPGYQAAQDLLSTEIDIPKVPLLGGMAKILEHRVEIATETRDRGALVTPGAQLADIMEDSAVETLAKIYRESKGSLRRTMGVAHRALGAACEDEADYITERQVRAAFAADL
jgi:hypothetical protein